MIRMLTSIAIMLFLMLAPISVHAPTERSKTLIDHFKERYSQWDQFDRETQKELINMYHLSTHKYTWFPKLHDVPVRGGATVMPRNYLENRMEQILKDV
jgi:hypothetical protein